MIPQIPNAITTVPKVVPQPSYTYKLDFDNKRISGKVDGLEAIVQMAFKTLQTERYAYPIYNDNYGVGLEKYIGRDFSYVRADVGRAITEALMQDDRVKGVENMEIEQTGLNSVLVRFDIVSINGRKTTEVVVNV